MLGDATGANLRCHNPLCPDTAEPLTNATRCLFQPCDAVLATYLERLAGYHAPCLSRSAEQSRRAGRAVTTPESDADLTHRGGDAPVGGPRAR